MRDVKIAFAQGWKKSKITLDKAVGYHNDCTVSVITGVPKEVSNQDLLSLWDYAKLETPLGKHRFTYYELLDAETTKDEDYRVAEHNKGDWAQKKK
mgnify:CR=1 FL=1